MSIFVFSVLVIGIILYMTKMLITGDGEPLDLITIITMALAAGYMIGAK